MKVFIAGASGFIGRHLAQALLARGHALRTPRREELDFARPVDWHAALRGIDVAVNAVGILKERGTQTFEALHERAARELFAACEALGVRRVVQISALGADANAESRFHLSKRRADEDLAHRAIDFAIVQPSLVFGPDGASTRLFLTLASLPLIPVPGDGEQPIQPIHIDDLTELLVRLVEARSPIRQSIAAVGPRALSLREYLCALRTQMGFASAPVLRIPIALVPSDRETLGMLERGNTASPAAIGDWLGRGPRDPSTFAGTVDALRARLNWLLPLLRATLAFVWIASGIVSLGLYPVEESLAMLARVGLTGGLARLALYGAASLDLAMGIAIYAVRRRRWLWRLQIVLIAGYSAIVLLALPELWLHPFGPLTKNLPILAAIALLHELEDER